MTRTHCICARCYRASPLQREPLPFRMPMCYVTDLCCYCGQNTIESIVVVDVLAPTVHCRCNQFTVHPKAPPAAPAGDAHYVAGMMVSGSIGHNWEELINGAARIIRAHTRKELQDADAPDEAQAQVEAPEDDA